MESSPKEMRVFVGRSSGRRTIGTSSMGLNHKSEFPLLVLDWDSAIRLRCRLQSLGFPQ